MRTTAEDLLLLSESPMKSTAMRFARRLGAAPLAVEFGRLKHKPQARRFLVYLEGSEPADELKGVLRNVAKNRYDVLVLYSAGRSPETAAKWGMVLGEMRPKHAQLCFEAGQVASILDLKQARAETSIDVTAMRKQLGLTQEQLASALRVSPRTVQNWEAQIGLGLVEKRTADLAELIDLLNDYIPSEQQAEWLHSASEAFSGRTPLELLTAGRIRDLIIEFRRLQAGHPM